MFAVYACVVSICAFCGLKHRNDIFSKGFRQKGNLRFVITKLQFVALASFLLFEYMRFRSCNCFKIIRLHSIAHYFPALCILVEQCWSIYLLVSRVIVLTIVRHMSY